jgi:hypothetical protein
MGKGGRFGKYGDSKRKLKLRKQKANIRRGRDISKIQEHFKISPKHPGGGRK